MSNSLIENDNQRGHPPISRLLMLYHRTMTAEEQAVLLKHILDCRMCNAHWQRVIAAISFFKNHSNWRLLCPSAEMLFRFVSGELPPIENKIIQTHLSTCFACREDTQIFREVRQAARNGHAPFLNPSKLGFKHSYWRHRGYLEWFFRGSQKMQIITAVIIGSIIGFASWFFLSNEEKMDSVAVKEKVIEVGEWSGRQSLNGKNISGKNGLDAEEEKALPPDVRLKRKSLRTVELPKEGKKEQYQYRYGMDKTPRRIMQSEPLGKWATEEIDAKDSDPASFKIGESLGKSGLIVFRPIEPLSEEQLKNIEVEVGKLLSLPNARKNKEIWTKARSKFQQLTGGQVWLMNIPQSNSVDSNTSQWAGPNPLEQQVPARKTQR